MSLKILFLAPEVEPFAKTGGLADVASALPKALASLGHEVRVVMPLYQQMDRTRWSLVRSPAALPPVRMGDHPTPAALWETRLAGSAARYYFIEQASYFNREGLYQDQGTDYPDNLERFSFFCQQALTLPSLWEWTPDILHCHDWQTALACPLLLFRHAQDRSLASTSSVLTVHNLAYQGLFDHAMWSLTRLPPDAFSLQGLEFYGKINCLKGGLVFADGLTTVSPTYAKEIQTKEIGCGLEGVLAMRQADLTGILNGIDEDVWNPKTDPQLTARYSSEELAGKSLCKLALQQDQQLPEHHGLLIGMIQRLAEQKGIDIFTEALEELVTLPIQIVLLGTGDPKYHEALSRLAQRFPSRLAVNLRFDDRLAHWIEAGSDAFLMPSRFEPCGLNQMYSMRYGTVPIVRRVGGLADTVVDVSPSSLDAGRATGFAFEEYSAKALGRAVRRAVAAFGDHELWGRLVKSGMQRDFSWARSARDYVAVYERARSRRRALRQSARPHDAGVTQPAR